jgi:hypothetical protein
LKGNGPRNYKVLITPLLEIFMVGAWCCGSIDGPTLMMHTGMIGCYDRVHPAKHINKLTLVAGGLYASTVHHQQRSRQSPFASLCAFVFGLRYHWLLVSHSPSQRRLLPAGAPSLPTSASRVDATKPHHGHRSQRRLSAANPTSCAPYSRHRYGPSRHPLAGGLHQPAADAPRQSQQVPPAARRIRSAPCL